MPMTHQELAAQFEAEIWSPAEKIDPRWGIQWHSFAMGWAMGKGLDQIEAGAFANHLQWDRQLG